MRLTYVFVAMALVACGPDARTGSDGGGSGDGGGPICVDGMHMCLGSTYQVCSGGQWMTQQECTAACDLQLGCVECIPGSNVCENGNVHSCTAAGEIGPETEACTGSNVCQNGQCVDACVAAATSRSYTGCEYWAVDLDNAVEVYNPPPCSPSSNPGRAISIPAVCMNASNVSAGTCDPPGDACPAGYTCQAATVCAFDATHAPFAIVVSNPQARAVDVTVTAPDGTTTFTTNVAAGAVQALMPQAPPNNIADQSIDESGIQKKAYKVTSTLPIVAYQFNPLDNVDVFSNDASLLVPRAAFDVEYYAMTRATLDRRALAPGKNPYRGYVSIVAWQDGTVVEVTPSALTTAGPSQAAIAANAPTMFTLNAHDVLTLQAAGTGDLTGTRIRATGATPAPIGVFGGHEATGFGEAMAPPQILVPTRSNACCADHLEDMMFPTSTWGKTFAIARSQPRGGHELDVIRIMAQKQGTTVTFAPAPTGTCNTLGPGAFCEVKISVDTVVTASEPVLIGHYLQSNIWTDGFPFGGGGTVGEGDPSMAIAVPTEQYRTDYTILVPSQYAKNFVSITAPMTGGILVDGNPVTMTAFGQYRAARVPVTAGQHKIVCPGACGVEVYGYSDAVSYMFAGGLDLKQIVIQ
ncbi:MAG: IgGFc-binding protein [Kofleriaceae bacterium]